jgi:NlpC/P60 family putative phage cell wall peptidase
VAVTRAQVVAEARTWVGTPFQHAQHCKGKGCDCIGLVIGTFKRLGCLDGAYTPPAYSQQWHAHKNEELLVRQAQGLGFTVKDGDAEPGDLLLFKFGRVCSHAGIYLGGDSFVHAYFSLKRVVMQPLRGELKDRMRMVMAAPPSWVEG